MELESLFHHIALPPKVPGKQEPNINQIERLMVERLISSARDLRDASSEEYRDLWDDIRRILQTCKNINAGGKLSRSSLLTELHALDERGLLILHIREQNAGLLVRRDRSENVFFEAFEASPLSESVLAAENALQWDFPGSAVVIPASIFDEESFQQNLASFLEQASIESIKRFAARAKKAGTSPYEIRDTADPALITQLLMTLLESLGRRTFPPLLRKRVRDEVCWQNGGEKPWRRSPLWLILRVSIQRQLYELLGVEAGRVKYKFLICHLLAAVMEQMLSRSNPEIIHFLKAKLNRRLAKLETDKEHAPNSVRKIYESMFRTLGPRFSAVNKGATQWIEQAWSTFKRKNQRPVPMLPYRAYAGDLRLSLPNSGLYLKRALSEPLGIPPGYMPMFEMRLPAQYVNSNLSSKSSTVFASRYIKLAGKEMDIALDNERMLTHNALPDPEEGCLDLAADIDDYLKLTASAYDSNPEQKSMMLLTVMESWVILDRMTIEVYPLLRDFLPGFPEDILDVVQLLHLSDMSRVHRIQLHLRKRHGMCGESRRTIFDDPGKGCFAERYFGESENASNLGQLLTQIEEAAQEARASKEEEWRRLGLEYEHLNQKIAASACLYTTNDANPFGPTFHDDKHCSKCYLQRQAKRMKIQVHEHPLPSEIVKARAVVFELQCPEVFAAYRDATWNIINTLGFPKRIPGAEPRVLLHAYPELHRYASSTTPRLSLGSTTKSFRASHYSHVTFPTSLEEVCLPSPLKFGYFDTRTKLWPARQSLRPSFREQCPLLIPSDSHFASLKPLPEFASDGRGPSSYEIIASQTKCPSGLNIQEFMAYQSLFSGKARRWPSILLELGASNLNFSAEATSLLISQLALQAGPMLEPDHLRVVHAVLRDDSFCRRLLEQLNSRLDGISPNWRETHCMDMLITLILRICSVASNSVIVSEALRLLQAAREFTSKWVNVLRLEVYEAKDVNTANRCGRYALLASFLCRKTFALHCGRDTVMAPADLQTFIECSITLQDNLVEDPTSLPLSLRNFLIADLKMVHSIRHVLRRSILANVAGLKSAISVVWPDPGDGQRRLYTDIKFLPSPEDWWIQITANATQIGRQQTAHYNLLEGHLLIDGQPLGKLPAQHRNSVVLEQLFGNQSLLVWPSDLFGMVYMLAIAPNNHQIHIGFRDGETIVRARLGDTILEIVPRKVFGNPSNFDLPAPLVENCVHWLDLRSQVLEVRQVPNIWRSIRSHWFLDLNSRLAQRRQSRLIDPHSALFQQVARIFDRFEYRHQLTVFQPQRRNLTVELRRLDLHFAVNKAHLLESPQLQSSIDLNQDPGCWYGLNSKIVLNSTVNPCQRSVIVPLGSTIYRKNGIHVGIDVSNPGDYGRFKINDVLGRLDCPPEPRLLFCKAQFHAQTSFVLPDPLTGRSGTEEAIQCLSSGLVQPWTPLKPQLLEVLSKISGLSCKREYYPPDLKVMQKVYWDEQLPVSVQSEEIRPLVEAIRAKSDKLATFAPQPAVASAFESNGAPHLSRRSLLRRRLYQSQRTKCRYASVLDRVYQARDRGPLSQKHRNVFECVRFIWKWPSRASSTTDLAGVLQNWPNIQGYDQSFDKVLLSDYLDVDFAAEWGPLVAYCQKANQTDHFRLIFLFAAIAFSEVDMDVIRTLMAFAVFDDLKAISLPQWSTYHQFRYNQNPHLEYLAQLLKGCCIPYSGDERNLGFTLNFKQRRKLEAAQAAYESQLEEDRKTFARFLLSQWPCLEPSLQGFEQSVMINMEQAMGVLRPEWRRLFQNLELSVNIRQIQEILDLRQGEQDDAQPQVDLDDQETYAIRHRGSEIPTLTAELICRKGPVKPPSVSSLTPPEAGSAMPSTAPPVTRTALSSQMNRQSTPYGQQNGHFPAWQPWSQGQASSMPMPKSISADLVHSDFSELESVITPFAQSSSIVRQQYGRDLIESLNALKIAKKHTHLPRAQPIDLNQVRADIRNSQSQLKAQIDQLSNAFRNEDSRAQWLQDGDLWPLITPVTLLETLSSTSASSFGRGMKESIAAYGLSITKHQRLLRIEDALLRSDHTKALEEQRHLGHENWSPLEKPDWLLLEIETNILIRKDQVDVANATIAPASASNSVLQLNMGQGKTSIIVPMAAAVLANSKNLVRIVVPKSLLVQTAQLLQARLGGLLGRRINHIPFSRKTSTSRETIRLFHDIHRETLRASGVILALPEHIMSFMLSGLQRLSDSRIPEATPMANIQAWLKKVCRDILDESDFTLAVRTQLIYPSGSQTTVDGHPLRWETAESLLKLVEGHLFNLQQEFPQSIEVVRRPQGGFPLVYFLRKDVEDALIVRVVDDVCLGRTSILPTRNCTKLDRLAIKQFITEQKPRAAVKEHVRTLFPDNPALRKVVYLLRGLLVHRVLLLTLRKRWNVQYGLHPERDPIAVPFHAKGVPSSQAEWGHPDVAILFTCLAFLYDGLNAAQLRQNLEHVIKCDDPSSEYDRWVQTAESLPGSLREWNSINVDDEIQLAELTQHFRYSGVVINYFLNHFVFPKHAKQFRIKLQASGWDLPLSSLRRSTTKQLRTPDSRNADELDRTLTTGFSGTNDTRNMLPLNIRQADLPGLAHTNAEVLSYLLQPRNRDYVLVADMSGRHVSETGFLRKIAQMRIRILIDSGAQILEMNNLTLVQVWLDVFKDAPAAVYFNSENKPYVLHRRGRKVLPLVASPYCDNLGECLIYLDDQNTRGTDLKFAPNTRGALTLGLGQTKDHTVQAAMRLRQLGTTQSVVFFAPPEVHQSILDLRQKGPADRVTSYDVICWLLEQTCAGIEQLQPLYYSQGADFCRRMQAATSNADFLSNARERDAYLEILRQTERQTLEQLYEVRETPKASKAVPFTSPQIAGFMKELDARKRNFQDTGNAVHGSALQEVEQEREVAFEVESVRVVQQPLHMTPLFFQGLHRDIFTFFETGRLFVESAAYEPAFMALRKTALGQKHGINASKSATRLHVTMEFMKTVSLPLGRPQDSFQVDGKRIEVDRNRIEVDRNRIVMDRYCPIGCMPLGEAHEHLNRKHSKHEDDKLTMVEQRQVSYVLWNESSENAMIVNPEEAEVLLPMLREAKETQTHLLTYATPVTRKMMHFNNLRYYAIPAMRDDWKPPSWLSLELGIFAGRLYFEFDEYDGLRKLLGIHDRAITENKAMPTSTVDIATNDGPMDTGADGAATNAEKHEPASFTAKPLTFLQEWLAIRRNGQDYGHTPMGFVCSGKPLVATHPFFGQARTENAPKLDPATPTFAFRANADPETTQRADSEDYGSDPFDDDDGEDGGFDDDDDESAFDGWRGDGGQDEQSEESVEESAGEPAEEQSGEWSDEERVDYDSGESVL